MALDPFFDLVISDMRKQLTVLSSKERHDSLKI